MSDTTGKALLEHWSWAAEKGLMNKNTAHGLRSACRERRPVDVDEHDGLRPTRAIRRDRRRLPPTPPRRDRLRCFRAFYPIAGGEIGSGRQRQRHETASGAQFRALSRAQTGWHAVRTLSSSR